MAVELLAFALAGCFLGIVTGMLPGLHVNTVALIALSMPKANGLGLVVLIASMSIVHTFVDFVPSILLGAPDSETFLGVLPGHRLLLAGKGLLAVKLTIAGGLFAGIASIVVAPLFVAFVEKSASFLSAVVPAVLIAVLAAMVWGEKGAKGKALASAVIALSGLLGVLALDSALPLKEPLFALATGFFGVSMLADSIFRKTVVRKQLKTRFCIRESRIARSCLLAIAGAWIVSLMPGIGASQAAFIVKKFSSGIRTSDYLVLLGGVNTATMILSFFVLFAWGKTRTGAASAVSQLVEFGANELLLVAAACLIGIGFGAVATDLISRRLLEAVQSFDYRKVNAAVLVFVAGLVAAFSGLLGITFCAVAAGIGLVAINSGIKRTNCMAFLMVPTILHYAAGFV